MVKLYISLGNQPRKMQQTCTASSFPFSIHWWNKIDPISIEFHAKFVYWPWETALIEEPKVGMNKYW
jgi:hypothetical protein